MPSPASTLKSPSSDSSRLGQLRALWRKLFDPNRPESPWERIVEAVKIRLLLLLHMLGVPVELQPKVYDPADQVVLEAVEGYTMTSPDRVVALCDAVRYVNRNGIEGSIVECGVWRGGSMMAAALTLVAQGDTSRELYLYDTFEGMSEPTDHDVDFRGRTAEELWHYHGGEQEKLVFAPLDDVKRNISSTGYPGERCHYVVGKVEETLPGTIPDKIALLRLDTDWYESTKQEMEYLMPRLVPGGVLILDDYGAWEGARKAVDEYFASLDHSPLLTRIDFTGRICVQPAVVDAPVVPTP